jgi:peptidoglycan/LPS O-acetylase OafA/YrhL
LEVLHLLNETFYNNHGNQISYRKVIIIKYRNEIDGLRAISILLVLIFHSNFFIAGHKIFPGGFIGVDIFFLISGYLISKILFNELKIKNKINFINFFERRIRRILPLLLTILFVTFVIAIFILLPSQLIEFSKSSIASIFFVSNIYFSFSQINYEAELDYLTPLLNTWSLGVEEQFYIFLPIIIFIYFKFIKKYFFYFLLTLFVFSYLVLNILNIDNRLDNFYRLEYRLWELSFGVLIGYIEVFKKKYLKINIPTFFFNLAFTLILLSAIFLDINNAYRNFLIFIPILCASIFIISNPVKKNIVFKILTNKYIVFIGLISYSLYLWHYPIFVFFRLTFNEILTNQHFLIINILVFLISICTYFLIEKPFRNKDFISFRKLMLFLLITTLLIFFLNILSIHNDGFKSRFSNSLSNNYEWDNKKLAEDSWELVKFNDESVSFKYDNKTNFLILGNSHAKDIYNAIIQNIKHNNYVSFRILKPENPEIISERLWIGDKEISINNNLFNSQSYIYSDYIIIASRFTDLKLNLIPVLFNKLHQDGKKVIIFSNKTEFLINSKLLSITDLLIKKNFFNYETNEHLNRKSYIFKADAKSNDYIKRLAESYNFKYIPIDDIVCDVNLNSCNILSSNFKKYYYDSNHWTLEGSRVYGKTITERLFKEIK